MHILPAFGFANFVFWMCLCEKKKKTFANLAYMQEDYDGVFSVCTEKMKTSTFVKLG